MKPINRLLASVCVTLCLILLPAQVAPAYPLPGHGAWHHAYVWHPAYRWGTQATRNYIRDVWLRGPSYAAWRQHRRYSWHW